MQEYDTDNMDRINIAWITSCREIGLDEKIGREIIDPQTGFNYGYRTGSLEALARLLEEDNLFSRKFNLVAVILDDNNEQYNSAWNESELWPRDITIPYRKNGDSTSETHTLEDITVSIPSQPWKDLRRNRQEGETRKEFRQRKAFAKSEYETQMLRTLESREVDLLVSDSYTTIFNGTMLSNYRGRIINVHPAITEVGNPYRLPGLTPTRDAYTRAKHGWVIVDDKYRVDIPEGDEIQVNYDGEQRTAIKVPAYNTTGVTVHVVSEQVDNGEVIMNQEYQFNPETITSEGIRTRNYEIKRELLPAAIQHYTNDSTIKQLMMHERHKRLQKIATGVR